MTRLSCMLLLFAVAGSLAGGGVAARADTPPLEIDPAVLKAEAARVDVVRRASAATLAIFAGDAGGGSGVIISPDGYALTNFHVAQPAGVAMKCGMTDGKLYDAVLVGLDPTGDVALIKVLGRDDFPSAPLGDSDRVHPGDMAFTIGNPFLLATDYQPTVAYGVISGVRRFQGGAGTLLEYADCIQTDAAINPGNSGGPLFDASGRLIGINGRGSFEKRGRVNVGVGYAISINQIKNFMGHLRGGRLVDHAELGAVASSDEHGRIVVTDIIESSDVYRRGLRYDDEIVSLAGRKMRTPNALKNVLGTLPEGWRVPLVFRHEGKTKETYVRVRGFHRRGELEQLINQQPHEPQPPPGKDPKQPDKDPRQPEKKPRLPQWQARPKPPPIPPVVAKIYQAKAGFANYHFNLLNQRRIWKDARAFCNLEGNRSPWEIEGTVAEGGRFRILLSDDESELVLPTFQTKGRLGDELASILDPPDSGGLFVALSLWRRLLTRGIDDFGDLYYLGTAPLPGREGLFDVLIGIHGGVECRFYFESGSGRLEALEMFADDDSDPCEVYFGDYREAQGRWLPRRLTVRYGDSTFAQFSLEKFTTTREDRP